MSPSRNQKKVDRAMAAARNHQPIRAAWADRVVQAGWYRRVSTAVNFTLLATPFCFIAALGIVFVLAETPEFGFLPKKVYWWAAGLVVVAPIVVIFFSDAFLKVLRKRHLCSLSSSEVSVVLSYLPSCPELLSLVRKWVVQSGDANLSRHEYGLIYRVASAAELRMAERVSNSIPPPEMDEYFYRIFPKAPRFPTDEDWHGYDKDNYQRQVVMLDQRVGHIAIAQTNAHASQMEEMLSEGARGSLFERARL